MPGTAADPVRLDPFRRLVEVHWVSHWLALEIGITFDVGLGANGPNATTGPAFVEPFTLAFASSVEAHNAVVSSAFIGSSGHWNTVAHLEDVVADGLPTGEGPVGLGDWAWNYETAFGGPLTNLQGPFFQWQDASAAGDPPDVISPGDGGPFDKGLDTSILYRGQPILPGAPYDVPFGPGSIPGHWGTGATVTDGAAEIDTIGTASFDLSGLTATYRGHSYTAIATHIATGGFPTQPGTLFVLMQRSDVTA